MGTKEILKSDKESLKQVEKAISSLRKDNRKKSQILLHQFEELRDNLKISIESNTEALKLGIL